MLHDLLNRYKKAMEHPEMVQQKVGEAQSVFSGFALKTCLFLFFIILLLGEGYAFVKWQDSDLMTLIERHHLFQVVAEEIHQVPFENLGSSRFEKNIDGKNYVFTVIMEDSFSLPLDMMGDTVPGVEDPFITKWKGFLMRSCVIEIMYLPENIFNLPIDAEPKIVKENFFVVKRANGDYSIVLSEPVLQQYNENVKHYREDLRRQAVEYIRQRDGKTSQKPN